MMDWTAAQGGAIDLILRLTLFLAVIALIDRLCRVRFAAWRNLVWKTVVAGSLLLPAAIGLLPELPISTGSTDLGDVYRLAGPGSESMSKASAGVSPAGSESPASVAATEPFPWLDLLTAVYVVGLLGSLLHLGVGLSYVARLRRRARRLDTQEWRAALTAASRSVGVTNVVSLLVSDEVDGPVQVGVGHPAIIVPTPMAAVDGVQQEAILTHELCHVRRRDYLFHVVARVARSVLWFHPLVWYAAERLRTTAEQACDDVCAVTLGRIDRYAECLLKTSASLRGGLVPIAATMARRGKVASRVERLADLNHITLPGRLARAGAMACAVTVLGLSASVVPATHAETGDDSMNITVDVAPAQPHNGTTLASSLAPLMQTAGHPQWSMDRLQGVMGHAFQFEMRAGGGGVMHDNLDWGYALAFLPEVAQFRTYEASKRDVDIDLPALKREARDAARESLDRGVPALVWQPMSREQKKGDTPAHHAYCWGLIVGYDEGEETYTIRHPFVSEDYTVGYDLIGHSDGVEWFNVTIFEQQSAADEMATHRTALGNAVALSEGTKFDNAEGFGLGFDAYELWRAAFESEDVEYHHSRHHTEMLKGRRLVAAAYLRELANLFRDAAVPLEAAAGHYDREQESLIRCMSCSTTGAGSRPTSAPRRAG